jgi:hypothetical protein
MFSRRRDQPANATIRDNAGNLTSLHEGFAAFNDPLVSLLKMDQLDDSADTGTADVRGHASGGAPVCFADASLGLHPIAVTSQFRGGGWLASWSRCTQRAPAVAQ